MAKNSLKSTLQLDLDPSGVVKGVAATTRELTKLNRTAGRTAAATTLMAGVSIIQSAFGAMRGVISGLDNQVQALNQMAFKFSPEAMQAQNQKRIAEMQAEQRIGKSIGLGAAAGAREEQERLEARATRIEANAPQMAGAMAGWESLKSSMKAVVTDVADQFLINLTDPSSNRTMTQAAFEAVGAGGFYGGEGFQGTGSARGMPYDDPAMRENNRVLREIAQRMGGN
jgi:hypothetical protein